MTDSEQSQSHGTVLVGAGVVGRAIIRAHTDVGIAVTLADQNESAIEQAVTGLALDTAKWHVQSIAAVGGVLPAVNLTPVNQSGIERHASLVIESIAERLDVKQAFFKQAESWFGEDAILCSNTSTIRLAAIGQSLDRPERLVGMHFFMPVDRRSAVEVIRATQVDEQVLELVKQHVQRLAKEPLVVADAPGFVVNRMLAPYLNQAMLLLCSGVSADRLETAALAYGMPMSPLELIDWIGTRTTFDAGRVYWQAFPSRIDPSPLIAALVKNKRAGRGTGAGIYDYTNGQRSESIADEVLRFAAQYHRELPNVSDDELIELLAIPMWIEAQKILAERVVSEPLDIETAMSGGLGYAPRGEWHAFFESLGSSRIERAIKKWSPVFCALNFS